MINLLNNKKINIPQNLLIVASTLILTGQAYAYNFSDNMPYSQEPPAGLSANNVPMFVSIGFDDNAYSDGMEWAINLFKNKTNPDGTPALATFFNTTKYINNDNGKLKRWWKAAESAGHEIGNHTITHLMDEHHNNIDVSRWTNAQWWDEINGAKLHLQTNHNASKMIGFRTPRLKVTKNTLTVVTWTDMTYDASIDHTISNPDTGKEQPWPYTLDNGAYGAGPGNLGIHQGLWEMPVTNFIDSHTSKSFTGFDYNMWHKDLGNIDGISNSVRILKETLNKRLAGNRAPMLFGAHTDIFSSSYPDVDHETGRDIMNLTYTQRREVMRQFIEYANRTANVYIVTHKRIIDWMRRPEGLDGSDSGNTTPSNPIAQKVKDFANLVQASYSTHFFQDGSKTQIVNNILNASTDIANNNKESAMNKLWTAVWYIENRMSNPTAKRNAKNTVKGFISQIGY